MTTSLNTYRTSGFIPILPEDGTDWVILLEDLEFAMSRKQLERITRSWNRGTSVERLAELEKRRPIEVLLALLHQSNQGKQLRPFAYRM